ncbi:hypothetical protein L208DRAFT_1377140 [Tricholoma matsutake]|nr:hypothetical protein L208DRAFT_1377140 [Tricholoma matsutake 945]
MHRDVMWQLEAVKGKLTVREGVNEKRWEKTQLMIYQQQKWTNAESRTAGYGGDGDLRLQCIAVDRMKKHNNMIDVSEKQTAGVIEGPSRQAAEVVEGQSREFATYMILEGSLLPGK